MASCVFCRILAGELPSSMVLRGPTCSAFMDIQPVTAGHLLVVPNDHAADLAELPEDTGAEMFRTAQRIAAAIRRSDPQCRGINLLLADGKAAGQEVVHAHLHVIPRFVEDGFGFRFGPNYHRKPTRSTLDEIADRVRRAL